ncbi:MAG TPA: L-ribulose-5-phosphate 4-epimerase AraD [Bacteroidota bacterium]|nr:L-ribulose-5-phosphate 4-epimerase AraD [Bacteroidota bacterium]
MLQQLKEQVCEANISLVREGLVVLTWGNASAVDRSTGMMVIKPSGVQYSNMKPRDMVVVSIETGQVVEGKLRPSSDAPTHRVLYAGFAEIGGIAHVHSPHATAWAQANKELPPFGTTHADHFHGTIPCTRQLTEDEIENSYEENTGRVILERFAGIDPLHMPAVFVASHAPFAWGENVDDALKNAITLEQVCSMASETLMLNPSLSRMNGTLVDKHFFRKHGKEAYYGQKGKQG